MLVKLIKYDLRYFMRILPTLYLAALVIAIAAGIFLGINNKVEMSITTSEFSVSPVTGTIISGEYSDGGSVEMESNFGALEITGAILAFALTGLIVVIACLSLAFVIERFKKNLLEDEAYLSLSLPANAWEHIASKLISSFCVFIVTALAIYLIFMVFAFSMSPSAFFSENGLMWQLRLIFDNWSLISEFTLAAILVLTMLPSQIGLIFAALLAAHNLPSHRGIAAFAIWFIVNAIIVIVSEFIPDAWYVLNVLYNVVLIGLFYLVGVTLMKKTLNLE
jgi:ABC-2 type transport system ATP-binding protein